MKGIADPDFVLAIVVAGVVMLLLLGLVQYIRGRKYRRDRMEETDS